MVMVEQFFRRCDAAFRDMTNGIKKARFIIAGTVEPLTAAQAFGGDLGRGLW